ncbi:hypothetical protein [Spirosoma validum]|uniref:Uncharacterized protein n=1 Tax=Spirosoma validum TaxID=2771355 RepID=A0A927GDX7_9BACT|nr:hypothetical protein [Spirosoma validum]MBD2754252.1 hypothetical protein [Spirosoma validum]
MHHTPVGLTGQLILGATDHSSVLLGGPGQIKLTNNTGADQIDYFQQ